MTIGRAAVFLVAMTTATRALAALGDPAESVDRDAAALEAIRGGRSGAPGFTVETLRSDAVTIREYVSPSGVVFAVAWAGAAHPDLDVLLGAHAADYRKARHGRARAGRRSQHVSGTHVVVETWGHMRHLQGRAYLPALLPHGVAVDEIR